MKNIDVFEHFLIDFFIFLAEPHRERHHRTGEPNWRDFFKKSNTRNFTDKNLNLFV